MNKFIALFIVFSLLALWGNLFAKERKGADLIIQKKDSQQVGGELIAVKKGSLLLKDTDSGADVSVDIGDIISIKIVRNSKLWKGAGWGFLIGGGIGAIYGAINAGTDKMDLPTGHAMLLAGGAFGVIGALIGGGIGTVAGTDKTIQFEGKSDSDIKEMLEELRKKARVPDFK